MPMLKTAKSGTASTARIREYLEREMNQVPGNLEDEIAMAETGDFIIPKEHESLIESYLEGGTRALSVDVSEDLDEDGWDWKMNLTRAAHGHDRPTPRGTPRTYYHFVLSPSIDEDCDLDILRAYAAKWTQSNFRNDRKTHEYAIVCHDDNEKGVPHAHIIVNVTDKASGRKLHIDNKEVVRLGNSAQEIGREFGLAPIREDVPYEHVGVRTSQPVYLTRGEREILSKGKYSWKWELRQVIWETAGRSRDFSDFTFRLRQQGYDVRVKEQTCADQNAALGEEGKPSRKFEYEYLLYTHKNGKEVRDDSLGAKFYRESLEREFTREVVVDGRKYASWELIKISKGEVPWKEDIRRAIDQIAPTVLSIPELQDELERQFGIKLTFNRRGITYIHSSDFKVRDVSLGLRYTAEGLGCNSILAGAPPAESQDRVATKRSGLYGDMVGLMERSGCVTLDDVVRTLGERRRRAVEEKADLASIRRDLGELNRLVLLELHHAQNKAFLLEGGIEPGSALYEGALMRLEHTERYLRDRAGSSDLAARQKEMSRLYGKRLEKYRETIADLERDQAVYDRFLKPRSGPSAPTHSLFNVSRTLDKHRIGSFHQLDQILFRADRQHLLAQKRLHDADERLRAAQTIVSDIRTCREAGSLPYPDAATADRESALAFEVHQMRLRGARARLSAAGIEEGDFEKQEKLYAHAYDERLYFEKKLDEASLTLQELKEAKETCESMQGYFKSLAERIFEQGKKEGSASASGGTARERSEAPRRASGRAPSPSTAEKPAFSELPIGEAKRRSQERAGAAAKRDDRHLHERSI